MKYSIWIYILGLFSLSCWNKQDHNVTRPEIPRYTLSGSTIDYLTGEPVPFQTINIIGAMMLYDVDFGSVTVQSDSAGHYTIDPIYPGGYTFYVMHNDCRLHENKISIEHADRELDIQIMETMDAKNHPRSIHIDSNSRYIFFDSQSPCFFISGLKGLYPSQLINETHLEGNFFCKTQFMSKQWRIDYAQEMDIEPAGIFQFTADNQYYYALKKIDSLLVFDSSAPNKPNSYHTDIRLTDIAYNSYDQTLYACTDSLLYSIALNPTTLHEIAPLPKTGFNAMTWNDNTLYFYHKQKDLLFKIDLQLQITGVYALINSTSNTFVNDVFDFHFDSNNQLWFTK